jgi:predicted O-methyltransferase YrrM
MVDSDMKPDSRLGKDRDAVAFWPTALDFIYKSFEKGPHVVGVPYCGPPPEECVYVFQWANSEGEHANPNDMRLAMYSREQAAQFAGLHPVAALPTGLIAYDMRVFELTDPVHAFNALVAKGMQPRQAQLLASPWFDYEWADIWRSRKASTEDVVNTRDMAMACQAKLGYNPLYCAWSSWAGHWKSKCVDKPQPLTLEQVGEKYKQALRDNIESARRVIHVTPPPGLVQRQASPPARSNGNGDAANDSIWHPKITNIGFSTDREELRALQRIVAEVVSDRIGNGGPFRICEIGSWIGESALAIARAMEGSRKASWDILCIDHFKGCLADQTADIVAKQGGSRRIRDAFLANTAGLRRNGRIRFLEMDSADGELVKETFDLIYLDGDHSCTGLLNDLEVWWPKLKPGGTMVGHDWGDQFVGVQMAVEGFFGKGVARIEKGSDLASFWVVQRLESGTAPQPAAEVLATNER